MILLKVKYIRAGITRKVYNILLILIFFYCIKVYAYPWPLDLGFFQERITATFGEFRDAGQSLNHCYNVIHLHDGVDMNTGTDDRTVWGVESEQVIQVTSSSVYTNYHDFQHLTNIQVSVGDYIDMATFLGNYSTYLNHLHFSDEPYRTEDGEDCGNENNPLFYLEPYLDNIDPVIDEIKFIKDNKDPPELFSGNPPVISGDIDIAVKAHDAVIPGGSNNGIYKIEWEVVETIPYTLNIEFYHASSLWNVNLIYVSSWSNTVTNWYNVTNEMTFNSYWHTSDYLDGIYMICVKAYDWPSGYTESCMDVIIDNSSAIGNEKK
jgi:hypothetical protein